MNLKLKLTICAAAAAAMATGIAMQRMDTLIVNGKPHQVAVRVIDNNAYVKLGDVAKAMDMVLIKKSDGVYEMTRAGGANQIEGLRGKVGETIFDGKWRFTVVSVESPEVFQLKNDLPPYDPRGRLDWEAATREVKATAGHKLYVITVRVANGVNDRRQLWTAPTDPKIRTSLTDKEARSHQPIFYDFPGAPIVTEYILPGAQLTFPVIFSLPADAEVKDLIFTLMNLQDDKEGVDVRVAIGGDGDAAREACILAAAL